LAINFSSPGVDKSLLWQQTVFPCCIAQFTGSEAKQWSQFGSLAGACCQASVENGVGDVARRRWLGKVGWPREGHRKGCSFSPAPKVNPREPESERC